MSEQTPIILPEEQSFSIRQAMALAKEYFRAILKKFWIVALLGLLGGGLMFYLKMSKRTQYIATLSYMLNNKSSGTVSPYAAIFGQLGFDQGNVSLEKMTDLLKSRRIIQKTLFTRAKIDGKDDLIINHFIRVYKLKPYTFKGDHLSETNIEENTIVQKIVLMVNRGLLTSLVSPGLVVTLNFTAPSQEFAATFIKTLFSSLSDYFVSTAIETHENAYKKMLERVDSLGAKLSGAEMMLAGDYDSHVSAIRFKEGVRQKGMERDVSVTASAYYEATKNLETARLSLDSNTPVVQLVDAPILPLTPIYAGKTVAAILGGIVGGVLAVLFIVIQKFIKDTLAKEQAQTA